MSKLYLITHNSGWDWIDSLIERRLHAEAKPASVFVFNSRHLKSRSEWALRNITFFKVFIGKNE